MGVVKGSAQKKVPLKTMFGGKLLVGAPVRVPNAVASRRLRGWAPRRTTQRPTGGDAGAPTSARQSVVSVRKLFVRQASKSCNVNHASINYCLTMTPDQ